MNKPNLSVLAAFHNMFDDSVELKAILTGGLWTSEVPEGQEMPYGVVRVVASEYEWTLTDSYIEHVKLELLFFATGSDVLEDVMNEFEGEINWDEDISFQNDDSLIHVYPLPRDTRGEFARDKEGNQIFSGSLTYHVSVWRA